jgi:eukaryotic-like serine/threonine-protein kinase
MTNEAGAKSSKPEHPSRIGKYAIQGLIGQGAMGQVFRAHDTVLNRHVAIKMMAAEVSADPQLSQRFLREAQSAAQLNHPNIVTLHDFGDDNGQLFMAMELLEGQDLSKIIRQGTLASLEDKLALMEQCCDGLAFAHGMQLVHRDLKPANIHVHTSGRVKIMDFGLARVSGSDMTRAGTIMGSPNYMSPEQVRGERADARSDVFAMGVVFYEVLSGRRAFEAEAVHAILYKVANSQPAPLTQLCPDLPPILAELVEKALQKEPTQRFSDAVEMREALEVCRRVLEGSLDAEAGIASLRESSTIIQASEPSPLETLVESQTLSSTADTRPAIGRRSATGSMRTVKLGPPGSGSALKAPPAAVASGPRARAGAAAPVPRAPAPPSRAGLYAALGLGVVVLAAVAFVALRPPSPPPVAPTPDPQAAALVAVALESQLEVARKSLEYKDLRGAIAAADKALRLDAANADAHAIKARAQAALDQVESAVREARDAAQKGDVEKATQAVSRVLAQMPDHPIAAELAPQLNSRFQSRAEDGLRQARSAAEAARRANASSLRDYADGARLQRQAEELLAKKQFTEATQKALESKKAYELARAGALELAAKPPAPTAAAPTIIATPPPPGTAPSVAPPAVAAQPTTLPPAPTTTPAAGPSDDVLVRRLLAEFERAIESKDVALYKSLRPNLSADEERKLRAAFESVRSQELDFAIESVELAGAAAVVRVRRSGRINGQPVPPIQQVFRLVKGPSGWLIREIGQ